MALQGCVQSPSLIGPGPVSPAPGHRLLSGLGHVATDGASAWSEPRHPQAALASLWNQVFLKE